jgi:outer membrane protein
MSMNRIFSQWIPAVMLASFLSASAGAADLKIATVDMKRIFDNYWKKKKAEAQLQQRVADMQKEDKNMIEDYKKVKGDYQKLLESSTDSSISPDERDKRKRAAEDKLKRMKDLEETIVQYERTMNSTLGDERVRMISNLVKEIQNVVSGKAKTAGFSLVIDTAAESSGGMPLVLYTNNENDMTDGVLTQLNATAPAETTKTEEPAADKADAKKDAKK